MKTIHLQHSVAAIILAVFFQIFFLSCSKIQNPDNPEPDGLNEQATASSVGNNSLSYCTESSYNLCWKKSNLILGTVKIKRGSDNNLYVAFKSAPTFYLMEVNLYCGDASGIPVSFQQFPYRNTFTAPFPLQEQHFVVNNPGHSFAIIAEAKVVKKAANGNITGDVKDGWANGCNGPAICPGNGNSTTDCGDLAGGSMITYSDPSDCFIQGPSISVEPDICAYPVQTYFGIHPVYNSIVSWSVPKVTVGGYDYTEAEARAIGEQNITSASDARFAFIRVATLKLSGTGYALSPTMAALVQTVETALSTQGKLSASGNKVISTEAAAAVTDIDHFISVHACPWRIE